MDPFKGITLDAIDQANKLVAQWARNSAISIASLYERADPVAYPGLHRLGQQLITVLAVQQARPDFESVVAANPVFWQAAEEISELDCTFTYLAAVLAVLADDAVTASRLFALAQATLPLSHDVRRNYAQGEALLWLQENQLVRGVPVVTAIATVEECDELLAAIRQRVARWPRSKVLLQALVDFEVRRAELLAVTAGKPPNGLQRLRDLAGLSGPELDVAKRIDPVWADSMEQSVDQWRRRETLLQQWIKWTYDFEPAEFLDLDRSVTVFESSGRPDLAWLTWRHAVIIRRLPRREVLSRQRIWLRQLLGAEAARQVVVDGDRNPRAGTASWPTPLDDSSDVWSGDLGLHPLLAIKVERELALNDLLLAAVRGDLRGLIQLKVKRAEILCDIGASTTARRELDQLAALRPDVRNSERLQLALENAISYVELRVLRSELRYAEAMVALDRVKDPKRRYQYMRTRAELAYGAGDFGTARETYVQFFAVAKEEKAYWAIMADLAAQRQRGREIDLLRQILPTLSDESWEAAGIRFLLGHLTADELMTQAGRSGKMYDSVQHECEGAFWAAQVALAAGRRDEGIAWLRRCVATGLTSYVEYGMAKAELLRLVPDESAPPQRSEGRSLYGEIPA